MTGGVVINIMAGLSLSDIRSQETEAVEAVARCYHEPVKYSLCAMCNFGGLEEEIALKCPAPGFVLAFHEGDFIHIKQEYEHDWLIGRVIGRDSGLGFIPSANLLQSVVRQRNTGSTEDLLAHVHVYSDTPISRPIILMGPSLKGYELTDLLQKALVGHLKKQFSDRLMIVRPDASLSALTAKQASKLKTQIYEGGKNDKLVYLDCDASFPAEIISLNIHPIIVYIQISRLKVLRKLIRETCRDSTAREQLLSAAYRLYDLPPGKFSHVITDSNLEDACQNLELFIESYWVFTHPPLPPGLD